MQVLMLTGFRSAASIVTLTSNGNSNARIEAQIIARDLFAVIKFYLALIVKLFNSS